MIKLTLYGAEDKPVKTLVRFTVRWSTLKRAAQLRETMNSIEDPIEQLDTLCALVADCFEGDATFDEIERGARAEDLIALLGDIMAEAGRAKAANFRRGATGKT